MKNKIANFLKFGTLLLGISFLLYNCERDEIIESDTIVTQTKGEHIIKLVPFSTVINSEDFSTIINKTSAKTNSLLRGNSYKFKGSEKTTLQIVERDVRVHTTDNYESYNFLLKNTNNKDKSSFKNLVIEKTPYKTSSFIVSYSTKENYAKKGVRSSNLNVTSIERLEDNPVDINGAKFVPCSSITASVNKACWVHPNDGYTNPKCANYNQNPGSITLTVTTAYCLEPIDPLDPTGPLGPTESTGDSNPDTGSSSGGSSTIKNPTNPKSPKYRCIEIDPITKKCSKYVLNTILTPIKPSIASELNLNSQETKWLNNIENIAIKEKLEDFYFSQNSSFIKVKNYVKGQIELERLIQKRNWKPSTGIIGNNPNLKYTHSDSDGTISYFKMTDGSIIVSSGVEKALSAAGDLINKYRDTGGAGFGEFLYIKLPNQPFAELLFTPGSTGDDLKGLFAMAGKDLGINLGRYVLPIEDIKILIDGKDFDGQDVARWKAAGGILLTVIPGGKALKPVSKIVGGTTKWVIAATKVNGKATKLVFKVVGGVVTFGNRSKLAKIIAVKAK